MEKYNFVGCKTIILGTKLILIATETENHDSTGIMMGKVQIQVVLYTVLSIRSMNKFHLSNVIIILLDELGVTYGTFGFENADLSCHNQTPMTCTGD